METELFDTTIMPNFGDRVETTTTISSSITTETPSTVIMTDGTRDEFPRDFPIFPQDTTTKKLTIIESDEEAVTVVPEFQESSSMVSLIKFSESMKYMFNVEIL